MPFDYLDFDYSEDDEGTASWDALASVTAERLPALTAGVPRPTVLASCVAFDVS